MSLSHLGLSLVLSYLFFVLSLLGLVSSWSLLGFVLSLVLSCLFIVSSRSSPVSSWSCLFMVFTWFCLVSPWSCLVLGHDLVLSCLVSSWSCLFMVFTWFCLVLGHVLSLHGLYLVLSCPWSRLVSSWSCRWSHLVSVAVDLLNLILQYKMFFMDKITQIQSNSNRCPKKSCSRQVLFCKCIYIWYIYIKNSFGHWFGKSKGFYFHRRLLNLTMPTMWQKTFFSLSTTASDHSWIKTLICSVYITGESF